MGANAHNEALRNYHQIFDLDLNLRCDSRESHVVVTTIITTTLVVIIVATLALGS